MGVDDPNDLERVDREIHINELKEEVREAAGGEMVEFEADDCPGEVSEQFWENVAAWENAADTSDFQRLVEAGVDLPPPDELDDEQLHATLWKVIEALAERQVFLSNTDHLDDRELYTLLFEELLHEVTKDLPPESGWVDHLDVLGSGSEEDTYLYLKYYADDDWRRFWSQDFPDDEIPDHEDPPYDRDRLLPKPPGPEPPEPEEP